MTKPKFKIGDHVMYQGNIYKIHIFIIRNSSHREHVRK